MAKTITIQSRIDAANFQKLAKLAEAKGISISLMVRLILIKFIEGNAR